MTLFDTLYFDLTCATVPLVGAALPFLDINSVVFLLVYLVTIQGLCSGATT